MMMMKGRRRQPGRQKAFLPSLSPLPAYSVKKKVNIFLSFSVENVPGNF